MPIYSIAARNVFLGFRAAIGKGRIGPDVDKADGSLARSLHRQSAWWRIAGELPLDFAATDDAEIARAIEDLDRRTL